MSLTKCECGRTPKIMPPTLGRHMEGTDQKENPGRFYSQLVCECGIYMDGPNHDTHGTELAGIWNRRQAAISRGKMAACATCEWREG